MEVFEQCGSGQFFEGLLGTSCSTANKANIPGYLETSQLLLLWDRVIGYGTLEILPVLAVAVFAFRRNNLMEVSVINVKELT